MSTPQPDATGERILMFLPEGEGPELVRSILGRAHLACHACADGEAAAWQEFIRRYHRIIAITAYRAARRWGENSPAAVDDLTPAKIGKIFDRWPEAAALGEKMDYISVAMGDARSHAILAEALQRGRPVCGHIYGRDFVAAGAASGISDTHEAIDREIANDFLENGVWIFLRGGNPTTPWLLADKEPETAPPAEPAVFATAPAVLPTAPTAPPAVDRTPPSAPPPPEVRAPDDPVPATLLFAIVSSAIAAALAWLLPIAWMPSGSGISVPFFRIAWSNAIPNSDVACSLLCAFTSIT